MTLPLEGRVPLEGSPPKNFPELVYDFSERIKEGLLSTPEFVAVLAESFFGRKDRNRIRIDTLYFEKNGFGYSVSHELAPSGDSAEFVDFDTVPNFVSLHITKYDPNIKVGSERKILKRVAFHSTYEGKPEERIISKGKIYLEDDFETFEHAKVRYERQRPRVGYEGQDALDRATEIFGDLLPQAV